MEENEIDLTEYFKTFWKWKYFIFLGTLVVGIIAVIASFSLPKTYRATATFLLSDSPLIHGSEGILENHYEILAETYRGFINSNSSLTSTLKKFQLDQNPYHLSLEEMVKLISVRSIPNSKLLCLDVDFKNPQLAADIANFLASSAVELNLKLNQGNTVEAQRFLNDEVNKFEQELKSSEKEFLDFQKQARMADLRKRMDTLLLIKSSLSQQVTNAEINLKGEESKEKKLAEEVKSRSPKITLDKSITDDPVFQQLLSSSSTQQKDLLQLKTNSEAINEAYGMMDQSLVSSRAEIDLLKSKINTSNDSLGRIDQELRTVQATLAKQEMEELKLKNRYQFASSIFQDFRRKLEEANINVASSSQELKIVDPAIPPSRPIKPEKQAIVAIAILIGAIGFSLFAFLFEYLQKRKEDGSINLK